MGATRSSGWVTPAPSVARTASTWSPVSASHSCTHCRQVSSPTAVARRAGRHGPSSICTSTASTPRPWAQATPATATRPRRSDAPDRGVSMRDCVLIGASLAHPRRTQYESKASHVVSSISVSHLVAET
jgi:hypothetical protein